MKLELVLDEVELPWAPPPAWTERLQRALDPVTRTSSASQPLLQVVLTDDATLREHNREYRGVDAATDVLSFSYLEGHEDERDALVSGDVEIDDFLDGPWPDEEEAVAGQVLVSLQTLYERGPVHTGDADAEVAYMVVHGLLHVLGHDHAEPEETERMRAHERAIMQRMGYAVLDPSGGRERGAES